MKTLKCEMAVTCTEAVTYLDADGYIYCREHGEVRQTYQRCRKLRPHELARLKRGEILKRY